MYFCTTNYITEISLRATNVPLYVPTHVQPTTSQKSVWELHMYFCTTNYITEISLRATHVPVQPTLYNQLHHRNQSESYKCTSVQPTTSQKSVWELHMYLCTTNYITEISLRATHVPLYNQLHHRNQSENYTCTSVQPTTSQKSVEHKCTSVQPTTSQKSVWELHMYFCTTNYITEISLRATNVPLYNQLHHRNQSESYTCTSVQPTTSRKSVWELQMYLCATNYITEIRLRATNVLLYNQLHHRNQSESYKCTTNYITEISLRATHVLLYNQLHHRNQSESYKCTSVQPTTSQKSVWELQMYICTTNCITEISLRATNVPLYNQLHHRNQSESYKCTSVQPTTSQKLVWELHKCTTNYITVVWELHMYFCTTNYITEISLRATNVLLYNQLHHRNQSESYKCTSVQPTASQKLDWELQMYLCATNYITEISESYKCTSVQPTTSQKSVWELHMYLCTTNYITEISLRATHVPLYNQLHHRNQSESYKCTSVQPTTSQKLVWELQMYLCTTNYITEISLRATHVQGSTLTFWPTCPFGQVPYWFYLPETVNY